MEPLDARARSVVSVWDGPGRKPGRRLRGDEEVDMTRGFVILLILAVVASGCGSSDEGGAGAGVGDRALPTARQAVLIADQALDEFDDAAVLVKVSTYPSLDVHADGTAYDWKVTYWSAAEQEQLDVFVREGELYQTETGTGLGGQPDIGREWVDSPEAIAAMGAYCSEVPDGSFFLMLFERDNRPEWSVTCGKIGDRYSGRIDGVSGELIEAWPGRMDEKP
jgi:hypothetical protein